MAEESLDSLRSQLSAIKKVTGVESPHERVDVRIGYAIGMSALLPLLAGLFAPDSDGILLVSSTPFLLAVLSGVAVNYLRCHPSNECPAQKRKYYRVGLPVTLFVVVALFGFQRWSVALGTPPSVANGSVMAILGLLLVIGGLDEKYERPNLPLGAFAIIGGLIWPICEFERFWVVMWALTAVGVLLGSFLVQWQMLYSASNQGLENGAN